MSIFASETTATVALPFDVPHTVTIQKLTGRDIEAAQAAHLAATVAGRSPRGWESVFKRLLAKGIATEADALKAATDPLAGYDRTTIVEEGLNGWSYTVTDDKGQTRPRPVTTADINDLDDEALEFIATEIMRLTKPGLFQTPEEQAEAKKNG